MFRWGKPEPKAVSLRQLKIIGGFSDAVAARLLVDDGLVREAAMRILRNAFPETRYLDVLNAVGLQLSVELAATRRDSAFRREVLRAYNARCSVCGYAGRLGLQSVGVEAAHVRWVCYGGPNEITNGIALCSLHHKLFDAGVFTVSSTDLRVIVSPQFDGTDTVTAWLINASGSDRTLTAPLRDYEHPNPSFLDWHASEVFLANSRIARSRR